MRQPGTNSQGGPWTDEQVRAVWNRGVPSPGSNPDHFRKDSCGAWIHFGRYGEFMAGGCGWEIDHIRPVAEGGTDDLENLQPLQWQNNRSKGDDWPTWRCAIPAPGQVSASAPGLAIQRP